MATAPAVITCPACKKRFKGKPELAGKKIKCPMCAAPFVVPAEGEAEAPAKSESKPDSKPDSKPAAAPVASTPYAPTAVEAYGVEAVDTQARCPNCAKPMSSESAVICLYCGYNTLTREHGKTKKLIAHTPLEHFLYLLPALSAAFVFLLIVLFILFFNLVLPDMVVGSPKAEWLAHESIRMWSAMGLLALLWGLGMYAFNTLALKPRPPDVEKE